MKSPAYLTVSLSDLKLCRYDTVSEDGNFGIGVWESKPGKMTYTDLEYDELMYVLDGTIILTDEHGKTETYGPGEGLVLPKGWSGTFAVPEGGVRKIWVSYMGGKKG